MLEIRALAKATEALHEARTLRNGAPPAKIVLSMVGKNYRLTQDMKDAASSLGLPLTKNAMTLRQVYADVPGQAVTVWDVGARAREAAEEIELLMRELLPNAFRSPVRRSEQAGHRERKG